MTVRFERDGSSSFSTIVLADANGGAAHLEILPLAEAEHLGVITYSPLGGGLLSGKFRKGARPDQGRLVTNQ